MAQEPELASTRLAMGRDESSPNPGTDDLLIRVDESPLLPGRPNPIKPGTDSMTPAASYWIATNETPPPRRRPL